MEETALPVIIPPGMSKFTLPAGEGTVEFYGMFLDGTDTDSGDRLRWAELQLWKITDTDPAHGPDCPDPAFRGMLGKQLWLVYTIGHSLAYHEAGSACNKGVRTRVRHFATRNADAADLEPCPQCRPADWRTAGPDDEFELEITWYSAVPCPSAAKVLEALSRCEACRHKHRDRCRCGCEEDSEVLSAPGRRLIAQVKEIDPDIAAAVSAVRKL